VTSSTLVQYFNQTNEYKIPPRHMGLVHTKDNPQTLNLRSFYLRDDYVASIAASLRQAPILRKVILAECGLNDKRAITILNNINLAMV
jgi:hypothetical protein